MGQILTPMAAPVGHTSSYKPAAEQQPGFAGGFAQETVSTDPFMRAMLRSAEQQVDGSEQTSSLNLPKQINLWKSAPEEVGEQAGLKGISLRGSGTLFDQHARDAHQARKMQENLPVLKAEQQAQQAKVLDGAHGPANLKEIAAAQREITQKQRLLALAQQEKHAVSGRNQTLFSPTTEVRQRNTSSETLLGFIERAIRNSIRREKAMSAYQLAEERRAKMRRNASNGFETSAPKPDMMAAMGQERRIAAETNIDDISFREAANIGE